MYRIVYIDRAYQAYICTNGKEDKYGTPKEFKTRKDAEKWIEKHSYKGMSFRYEIEKN